MNSLGILTHLCIHIHFKGYIKSFINCQSYNQIIMKIDIRVLQKTLYYNSIITHWYPMVFMSFGIGLQIHLYSTASNYFDIDIGISSTSLILYSILDNCFLLGHCYIIHKFGIFFIPYYVKGHLKRRWFVNDNIVLISFLSIISITNRDLFYF